MSIIRDRIFPPNKYADNFGNCTFLILDDKPSFYEKIKKYFEDYGLKLIHCLKPEEFFEKLTAIESVGDNLDNLLLLIDLQLDEDKEAPENWERLGGIQVIKRLKDEKKDYPIIAISHFLEKYIPANIFEGRNVINFFQKTKDFQYLCDSILASFLANSNRKKEEEIKRLDQIEEMKQSFIHNIVPSIVTLKSKLSILEKKLPDEKDFFSEIRVEMEAFLKTKELEIEMRKLMQEMGKIEAVPMNIVSWLNGWYADYFSSDKWGKEIEVEKKLPTQNKIMIKGSAVVLEWVLDKLISNAITSVKIKEIPKIIITLGMEESGYVFIKVRDYGDGFPSDILEKLFTERVTTILDYKKHGFGLYLSRKLIAAFMDGFLTPKNEKEDGVITGASVCISLSLL